MAKIIYKLTSPNGKIYIGQTSDFEKRLISYKGIYCKNQKKLYNSLKLYGFDAFKCEVIRENIPDDLINIFEECYIVIYDSFHNGLNSTNGGEGGDTRTRNETFGNYKSHNE